MALKLVRYVDITKKNDFRNGFYFVHGWSERILVKGDQCQSNWQGEKEEGGESLKVCA